jgi:hypothetical protein
MSPLVLFEVSRPRVCSATEIEYGKQRQQDAQKTKRERGNILGGRELLLLMAGFLDQDSTVTVQNPSLKERRRGISIVRQAK